MKFMRFYRMEANGFVVSIGRLREAPIIIVTALLVVLVAYMVSV